jgi:hypothetical protein
MSKMGLHEPFENLKHKLWPKERLGVKVSKIKMSISFPPIKSHESPWNKCVQVKCYISLKFFRQEIKLYLKPHLNRRFTREIMALQSVRSLNFGNLGLPTWESQDKMTFECSPHG